MSLLIVGPIAIGGTIRHDDQDFDGDAPDDHLYTDLATQYPSVGWFNNSSGSGVACSWTLIGSEWALTAAHCFEVGSNPENISLSLGTPDFATPADNVRGASAVYVHPNWKSELFIAEGWDIALVRLNDDIESVEPSKINRTRVESGEVFTYVGYGQTGTGQGAGSDEPAGTKRAGRNVIDDRKRDGRVLVNDFDSPSNADLNQLGASSPIYLEYNTAPGDSGGGGFLNVDGEERVGSIVSYSREGDIIFGGEREDNYGELDFHVSVRQFDHWIDATITQYANENHWTGGSGDFFDAANWSGSSWAGPDDTAVFNRDGAYTVDGGTAVMRRMVVHAGDVTYDTEGRIVYADYDPRNDPPGDTDPTESMIVGVTELDDPTLRLTGGGIMQPWRMRIAELPGSFGRVEVGAGTDLRGNMIKVGLGGEGELHSDNASVTPAELRIGNNNGATGDMTATNSSSIVANTLVVGHYGHGTLELGGGSTLTTNDWAVIARHPTSEGSGIELDGATWNATHEVRIGKGAFGYVQVGNGSTLDATGQQVYLGFDFQQGLLLGGGSMIVRDPGSSFAAGDWIIGWGDTGSAGVRDGATATANVVGIGATSTSVSSELTVDDAQLDVTNTARIGREGQGAATVEAGGQVDVAGQTIVGHADGSEGLLTVTGANGSPSTWQTDELFVGHEGVGDAVVEDGAQVEVTNGTSIAHKPTAAGSQLAVRGAGSRFIGQDVTIGNEGVGGLLVEQQGELTVDDVTLGSASGSIGQATFDHATIHAGLFEVGAEGVGFATIRNATVMDASLLHVSFVTNGSGTAHVESGSQVTLSGGVTVGWQTESSGELNVGGYAEDAQSIMPTQLITQDENRLNTFGGHGSATVNVTNGGRIDLADDAVLGRFAGGEGELTVGGAAVQGEQMQPAMFAVGGSMAIGKEGRGTVTAHTDGVVDVTGYLRVGDDLDDGDGRLIMEGGTVEAGQLVVADRSALQFRQDFKDGRIRVVGDGNLGLLVYPIDLHIDGTLTGGVAQLELANEGTAADLDHSDLIVGNGNEGHLLVRDGAVFDSDNLTAGWTDDALGHVEVRNGQMNQAGDLIAGRAGTALVDVNSGGQLTVAGDATLAQMTGSQASINIAGVAAPDLLPRIASQLQVTGQATGTTGALNIGRTGDASLGIFHGGRVDVEGDVNLATGAGSSAGVYIYGSADGPIADLDARLNVGGDLNLSRNFDDSDPFISLPIASGNAALLIASGGVVDVEGETNLGTFLSANAELTIVGGRLDTTDLNVVSGPFQFQFGQVHIRGGRITGLAGNDFTLGALFAEGSSQLELTNGAEFHLQNAQYDNGTLTDPGDRLTVGDGSFAEMNVLSGSSARAGSAVIGDSGAIIIPIDLTTAANDTPINLPPPGPTYDGQVTVDGNGSTWTIGHTLDVGQPVTEQDDPLTTNTGRLTIANDGLVDVIGTVSVNPGSMLRLIDGRIDADGVFLHPGPIDDGGGSRTGRLTGAGTIGGPLINVGLTDIGNSPGTITVEGDYLEYLPIGDLGLTGKLLIDLGGYSPGIDFDLLEVLGNADLAGTLDVRLADGFLPVLDDRFEFLTADSVTGTFNELILPTLSGSLAFDVQYNPAGVDLLVIPEPASLALLGGGAMLLSRRRRCPTRDDQPACGDRSRPHGSRAKSGNVVPGQHEHKAYVVLPGLPWVIGSASCRKGLPRLPDGANQCRTRPFLSRSLG